MISNKRHDEKTRDGKPIYVVETYNTNKHSDNYGKLVPFDGMRERVRFYQGVGRTTNEHKAKLFDEVYGYVVYLPKGVKSWKRTKHQDTSHIYVPEDEDTYIIDDSDELEDPEIEPEDEDSVAMEDVVNAQKD